MSNNSDVFSLIDDVMSRVNRVSDAEKNVTIQEDAEVADIDTDDDSGDLLFQEWRSDFLSEIESVMGKTIEELLIGYPLRNLYERTDSIDEAVQRFLSDLEHSKGDRREAKNFREWSREVDTLLEAKGVPSLQELRDSGFMSASSLHAFFLEHRVPEDAAEYFSGEEQSSSIMSMDEIADFHKWVDDLDLDADNDEDDDEDWEDEGDELGESAPPDLEGVFDIVQESAKKDPPVNPNSIENLMSQVMVRGEKPSPKDELANKVIPGMLDIVEDDIPGASDIMEQASQALRGFVDVTPEKG